MNVPIQHQLRDYFDMVDRVQGPVDTTPHTRTLSLIANSPDANDSTMEVIMRSPDTNRHDNPSRHWLMAAAAIAALALIGGLIFAGTSIVDDQAPADEPEPTAPASGPQPLSDAQALPFAGSDVQPGPYITDLLGTQATFEVPETTRLWKATANRVLLIDNFSSVYPVTSRTLSLTRISGWNTAEEGIDPAYLGPGSIDPYDVQTWIDANNVVAGELTTTTVAGRPATVFDVQLEPAPTNQDFSCIDEQTCVFAASISGRTTGGRPDADPLLSTGQVNRFWLITIDGSDPLLIHASTSADDEAWLRTVAETTIATLQLGPDAPPAGAN